MLYKITMSILILLALTSVYAQEQIILDYTAQDTIKVTADREQKFPQSSSIGTKIPMAIQNAPSSISIVSKSINQIQGNHQLDEALTHVSGVNIQTGFGVHDYFTMRGFNTLDNGLILTNGTKEPEATTHNLYNIEQVEVLKGPSAFLYGGTPLSGTANLVRKRPNYKDFLNFSSSFGSYNTARASLDGGKEFIKNKLSGRLNAIYQQSDLYRDDKAYHMYAFNPSLSWKPDEKSELNINLEYIRNEYESDSGLPLVYNYQTGLLDQLADIDRTTSFQPSEDYSNQDVLRFKLNYNRKLNDRWQLSNKLYYTDLSWKSTGTLLLGAYPFMDGSYWINRSMQILDDRQKLLGNQFELSTQFNTGALKHHLLIGLDVNQLTDDFTIDVAEMPVISLNNPIETFDATQDTARPYQFGEAASTVIAPYFVDMIHFSQKTRLFLGGRYDIISFKEKIKDLENDFNEMSPMLGISHSINENITFYSNASQAFAPPSSRTDGTLKPEHSKQIEAGIKNNWLGGKIRSTLSLYQLDKEDIAIANKNGFIQQIGSQKSQGIEFEVTAQMTEKCATIFSYAYTETEMTEFAENVTIGRDAIGYPITMVFDRTGNEAAFAPNHILNFWHSRKINSHLGFSAGVRYISDQYIAEDNVYQIKGYVTFNANIYYQLKSTKWYIDLKNISNTKYEMRGFGGYSVIPAMPFTINGRLEFSLFNE